MSKTTGYRIAHDYRGIDRNIVFEIINNESKKLRKVCEKLLQQSHLHKTELKNLLENTFFKICYTYYGRNELVNLSQRFRSR
jgi:hypothetical protein